MLATCPKQVVRVVLVEFRERHRHANERAALHRSRLSADQSGKRVASWAEKSPNTPDTILRGSRIVSGVTARMSQGCYEETTSVEFQLDATRRRDTTG